MSKILTRDLVGQTLYAKKRVPKLRWDNIGAPVLGYVEAGMPIGVIRSWIGRKQGDPFWYWEFDDPSRPPYGTFYVPHDKTILDLPQLLEDYQDNLERQRREKLEWWERLAEDGADVVQNAAAAAGSGMILAAAGLGVGYLLLRKLI